MEKINLEVKVKGIETAVGTVRWFKNYLKDAHLELGKTKDRGMACISLCKGDGSYLVIAFVESEGNERPDYNYYGEGVYALFVEGDDFERNSFVSYATSACYKMIDNFINDCVGILEEYLIDDSTDFEIKITNLKG